MQGIIEYRMTLRPIALAVALACGFTAVGEAKKNVVQPAAKSMKVKKGKKVKVKKFKQHKPPKIKHH